MRSGMANRAFAGLAAAAVFGLLSAGAGAEEQVTDEMIRARFGRAHDVMMEQRKRIQEVLDGFLMGDMEAVRRNSAEISRNMSRVGREFPAAAGQEADIWKAMAGIVESAKRLEEEAVKGDHEAAHKQFSVMTGKCVECHQLRRSWGLLPEVQEEAEPQKNN